MTEDLGQKSGIELVKEASCRDSSWKDIGAELKRRPADAAAAQSVVNAYRSERMPAWLTAYLLGCARAPVGYDVAREIVIAAPGSLAESYAGPAMARIGGAAAHDDLARLMMDAPRLHGREGAAFGLGVLKRPGTAELLLHAVRPGRIRRDTAAGIVGALPDARATIVDWFGREDDIAEAMALSSATSLLARTAGAPDTDLVWAIRRSLDGRRVKIAPRTRASILKRICRV